MSGDRDDDPEAFWQARYPTATGRVWSGEPHPTLVAETAALEPGRALLVVAHSPLDLRTGLRRPPDPDPYASAQEMADLLGALDVTGSQERPRSVTGPHGKVVAHDAVLRTVRRSAPRPPRAEMPILGWRHAA